MGKEPLYPVSCVKEAAYSKSKGSQRKMAYRRSKQFTRLIGSCLHHMTDLKATLELSVQYVELTRDIEAAAIMSSPIKKKLAKLAQCFMGCSAVIALIHGHNPNEKRQGRNGTRRSL